MVALAGGRVQTLTRRGHEGAFWADGNVLYLVKGLGCPGIRICQSSTNIHLRCVYLIVLNF